MSASYSENAVHRANLLAAEVTLQTTIVGATQAAIKSACLTYYRTARSSAITNGLSPAQFDFALKELGVNS